MNAAIYARKSTDQMEWPRSMSTSTTASVERNRQSARVPTAHECPETEAIVSGAHHV